MASHWVAVTGLGVILLVACGSSPEQSEPDSGARATGGAGNAAGAGAAQAGGASAASGGAGGAASGSKVGGSGGGAGTRPGVDCRSRTSNHVAGTRLRARNWVTADGARSWDGWHDSELGEDCTFENTADGKHRCVPGALSSLYFADASCTEPLAAIDEACAGNGSSWVKVVETERGECSTRATTRVYPLGEPYEPDNGRYRLTNGRSVKEEGTEQRSLYRLGAEAPLSTFVEAEEVRWEGPGNVSTVGLAATDGTIEVTGWEEKRHDGEPCWFALAEDGVLRCIPSLTKHYGFYEDASCQKQLWGGSNCYASNYVVIPPQVACDTAYAVRRRGPEFTGEPFSSAGGGAACLADTTSPKGPLYEPGEPVHEEFTALKVTRDETAKGRLQPEFYESEDGGCWFKGWYDTELDVECFFVLMPDGKEHCAPLLSTGWSGRSLYRDPDCREEEWYKTYTEQCPGGAPPKFLYEPESKLGCSWAYTVYELVEVAERSALPTLYGKGTDGTCQEVTLAAGTYARYTRPSPSKFVEATLMYEASSP